MPRLTASRARFGARPLIALALTASAAVALTACSSSSEATVGSAVDLDVTHSGQPLPFTVEVSSFDPAPASVQEEMTETGETIYYAEVAFTYRGDAGATLPPIYGNVYTALEDGSFLSTTFTGMTECTGSPEDTPAWLDDLAAGETVDVCVPLVDQPDNPAIGVYVGSSDVNDGGVVFRP